MSDPATTAPDADARGVVLIAGPWLAGTTSLLGALRTGMPEWKFVDAGEGEPAGAPVAVVFVTSAVSPLTESDCALVDSIAAETDLVLGVVSKIDTHRCWRGVLGANRAMLTGRAERYRQMPWVGAAAAPDVGEPILDELIDLLRRRLAAPHLRRRNRLRQREHQLTTQIARHRGAVAAAGRGTHAATLRRARDDIVRRRRLAKSQRALTLRSEVHGARVALSYFARNRVASVRTELQHDAATCGRAAVGRFEPNARSRLGEVLDQVDREVAGCLGDIAIRLGLPVPDEAVPPPRLAMPPAPRRARRLETQLMTILGLGFGLGMAVVVVRLLAGLTHGHTIGGLTAGALVGLLLTVWVIRVRGVLHDRAVLDRWLTEAAAILRSAVEERVATLILHAETTFAAALGVAEADESTVAGDEVARIDAELRDDAAAAARARQVRDRRVPPLLRARAAVRTQLDGASPATAGESVAPTPRGGGPRRGMG